MGLVNARPGEFLRHRHQLGLDKKLKIVTSIHLKVVVKSVVWINILLLTAHYSLNYRMH